MCVCLSLSLSLCVLCRSIHPALRMDMIGEELPRFCELFFVQGFGLFLGLSLQNFLLSQLDVD